MAVTGNRLRALMASGLGYYFSGTASGGSTTTIADTSADGFDAEDDNETEGKWAHLIAADGFSLGAPEGQARLVTSVSTSTLTVDTAYTAAVVSTDPYELLPYHPRVYNDAIAQAIRLAYPMLYAPLKDETLVVDNLLTNASFETFSTTFTGWANIGTPTLAQSTTRVKHGSNSASITATGATEGIEQNAIAAIEVRDAVGKTVHVRGWAYATVASAVMVRITFDGSTYATTFTHGGDDEWERVEFEATIPADASEATVSCEVTDGNVGIFDLVTAWVEPLTRYTIPSSFVGWPARFSQQVNEDDPNGLYLPLGPGNRPIPGRVLRLDGAGYLTVPTATYGHATDGSTEVNEPQAEYLVAAASAILFRRMQEADPARAQRYGERAAYWEQVADTRMRKPGVRMKAVTALDHKGIVRPTKDSTANYFDLVR